MNICPTCQGFRGFVNDSEGRVPCLCDLPPTPSRPVRITAETPSKRKDPLLDKSEFSDEAQQKFWARVEIKGPDECWLWKNSTNKFGHGSACYHNRLYKTHRLAYAFTNGTVPQGLLVRHSCDNPPCCNPGHLLLGTIKDNSDDMMARKRHLSFFRTHCPKGHAMVPENIRRKIMDGKLRKGCKACEAEQARRRYFRKKALRHFTTPTQ
jgi:hypothetical protein